MNIRKRHPRASAAVALGIGFCALSMASAQAKNVVLYPDADFSSATFTISFGGGVATYTFTYINDGLTADAVSTGGTALVNSFVGVPIPFELGTPIGGNGYDSFTAFPSPTGILYSVAEDSIGLQFQLPDGVHFGYVTTLGPEVIQYGYNDTPGASIGTGAAAPEPATWVMFILGLGVMGALGRRSAKASLA